MTEEPQHKYKVGDCFNTDEAITKITSLVNTDTYDARKYRVPWYLADTYLLNLKSGSYSYIEEYPISEDALNHYTPCSKRTYNKVIKIFSMACYSASTILKNSRNDKRTTSK